jgi:fibronectin type 3 domain-containing protein
MKAFYHFKILLILVFTIINTSAFASKDTIAIAYSYNKDKGLMMKFIPTSPEVFFAGFKLGYNLYRDGSEKLAEYVKLNNEVIKFWSKEKLKEEAAKDSNLLAAAMFIGGADDIINRPVQNNANLAGQMRKADNFLNFLGNFAAISNNHVAEAMGVFWIDKDVNPEKKYVYKLEIPTKAVFTSYTIIYPLKNFEKEKVLGFSAKLDKGSALLKWFNNGNRTFPYYNIYRSTNKDKGFVRLNKMPYIGNVGNAVTKTSVTSFVDSFPQYNKTYYYKVVGVNAFEEEGVFSEVLELKADYVLQNFPVIISTEAPDNKNITIKWKMDEKDAPYVVGYRVKHATKGEGPYKVVNKELIDGKTFTYTDTRSKGSSNYYVLCAYGASGDSTCSFLKSQLLVDTIPPSVPVVVYGVCDTNGIVTIKWAKNQEPDMLGYRVFKTYDQRVEPYRLTKGYVKDTLINDTISLKEPYNKIFYRVASMDDHFNPSAPSLYFEVKIPDKIPPINGYFESYSVGMNGITLKWHKSNAYDLKAMHILRKGKMDVQYHEILRLEKDSLKLTSFTDTSTKSNEKYAYVIQSEDEAGLLSDYSRPLVAEQINKVKIFPVTNLEGFVSRENKMVKLTWQYPYRAKGFKIYRAKNDEPLTTYEFVAGDKREFYDKWMTPNSGYKYLIVAELENGFISGYSNKLEIKY